MEDFSTPDLSTTRRYPSFTVRPFSNVEAVVFSAIFVIVPEPIVYVVLESTGVVSPGGSTGCSGCWFSGFGTADSGMFLYTGIRNTSAILRLSLYAFFMVRLSEEGAMMFVIY